MNELNKRTKICIVGPSKRFFSGVSAYTICLANALSKDHDTSALLMRNLLPQSLYPGKGHVGRDDYSIDLLPQVAVYEGMDWNSPLSWFNAYRFLRQQRPDTIIMMWWTSSIAHMQLFLALVNRLKIKARLIVEMHEILDPLEETILPFRLYSRMSSRLLMSGASGFVVHSPSVKKQVMAKYHLEEDRVFVLPHSIYQHYYRNYNKQVLKDDLGIKEEFVVLHFGSIRKYKGIPYLVKAFSALPPDVAENSRLVVAGEDWGDDSTLGELIDSSPYKHKITFNPYFVPDDMIPRYFSIADVVALPYVRTSGSGVAAIAMAYGKPIITSDLDTMRECLEGYRGACFAAVGDSSVIKEKLLELYQKQKSGEAMLYEPPQNTWDEIASKYGEIMSYRGSDA
ncbi:MAG: glycosyltransferase [Dehalococcoidia bacterium]|nr:MAG: glycosyltransferase [Dehalococcoidia bacterium]